jgi:hypothetical protein
MASGDDLLLLLSGAALGQQLRVNPEEGTPLASARQSLQLACARVLEVEPDAAAAALRQAARHLAAYETLFPGPRAEQAEYMRQQILEQTARMHDDPNEWPTAFFTSGWSLWTAGIFAPEDNRRKLLEDT